MTNEETKFWDAVGNFDRAAICKNWEEMDRQYGEMLVYHRLVYVGYLAIAPLAATKDDIDKATVTEGDRT